MFLQFLTGVLKNRRVEHTHRKHNIVVLLSLSLPGEGTPEVDMGEIFLRNRWIIKSLEP